MAIVFRQNQDGTYDLEVDGRAQEYDVAPDDFSGALRRRRIAPTKQDPVFVEDQTGYRKRLGR